jgi:hypothetical protein
MDGLADTAKWEINMSFTIVRYAGSVAISALLLLGGLGVPSPAAAEIDEKVAQPNSMAHGRSLAGWLREYWRAALDTGAERDKEVLYLPIPDGVFTGGSGTPDDPAILVGVEDVTIKPGTSFVLPLVIWVGESTDPLGQCDPAFDDPTLPDDLFGSDDVNAVVTLDGLPIVEDNQAFYVPRTDLGCITTGYPDDYPLPEGTFSAAVFIQGIGFLANPLPRGEHVLTLDGTFIVRDPSLVGFTFGVKFDNTWNITVER